MNDAVRTDVSVSAAAAHAGSRAAASTSLRRLKRLGAGFSEAVGEVLQGVQAARHLHPVISAYRR